ncbi:hypothetical protein [Bradyrhizobium elkanii]|uniref:hypothetical protein n=1 Tax=Bradyrhizobium elkanii TaxID=29448 RepID=UPI00272A1A90|nr:hypothetical protein [Bradyrhizobium elkanii]WLA80303.1 hypothetical protein QNJ99_33700 [Bradyrhizobium elkanii]
MTKKKKKTIDWKGIERDFRAGKTSTRQIAEWYGISEGAIRKRAKAENWSQLVSPAETADNFRRLGSFTPEVRPSEAKTVIAEGKSLAHRMLDELGATTSLRGELEELIIEETSGDKDGRRRQAMLRAVDLPNRAKTLKDLMLAAKTAAEVARMEKAAGDGDQPPASQNADKPADDWDRLLN